MHEARFRGEASGPWHDEFFTADGYIKGNMVYAIDSESGPLNHVNWRNGLRIGPLDEDRITAFIPPFEREDRVPRDSW